MAARASTFSAASTRGVSCRNVNLAGRRMVSMRAEEPAKEQPAAPVEVETPAPAPAAPAVSMGSIMAFDGAAPELVNGRLAMIGFFSALGAELSSGEGVIQQLKDAPLPILATFGLFAAASFVPMFKGLKPEDKATGPFTAAAEMLNGRAAMIGLAALLLAEAFTSGKALL